MRAKRIGRARARIEREGSERGERGREEGEGGGRERRERQERGGRERRKREREGIESIEEEPSRVRVYVANTTDKSRGKKRKKKDSAYFFGTHYPYTTHRVSLSPDLCDKTKNSLLCWDVRALHQA